jgi:hypothetical protein
MATAPAWAIVIKTVVRRVSNAQGIKLCFGSEAAKTVPHRCFPSMGVDRWGAMVGYTVSTWWTILVGRIHHGGTESTEQKLG